MWPPKASFNGEEAKQLRISHNPINIRVPTAVCNLRLNFIGQSLPGGHKYPWEYQRLRMQAHRKSHLDAGQESDRYY